ncbi:unnamed protein product, partial [Owenia fusiformis]
YIKNMYTSRSSISDIVHTPHTVYDIIIMNNKAISTIVKPSNYVVWFIVTTAVISAQIENGFSQTVPEKPLAVRARYGTSSTSISLAVANTNTGATHYIALYEHNSILKEEVFPCSGEEFFPTEHTIDKLSPFTNYTFCVYSVIRSGGPDQNSSSCTNSTPLVTTGPGPITNFNISDVMETSMLVVWEKPKIEHRRLTVRYQLFGKDTQYNDVTNNNENVNLTGLNAGVRYSVWTEVTYEGYTAAEQSSTKYSLTKPFPPSSITSRAIDETTIIISWEEPLIGNYTGYEVHYDPIGVGSLTPPINLGRQERSITLSNLTPATNITVNVRAVAKDEDIQQFSRILQTSQFTKPLAPIAESVLATAINDTAIQVRWTLERAPVGGYHGYRIFIIPATENELNSFLSSMDTNLFRITDLYPGRLYNISVR